MGIPYSVLLAGFWHTEFGSMADHQRIEVAEIVRHFVTLQDRCASINRHHSLASVIVIAMMAVLAGAGGPTAIARWAVLKEAFLLKVLDLPHGIPSKDVFRRVLMALRPGAFQACFVTWLTSLKVAAAPRPVWNNPCWRWTESGEAEPRSQGSRSLAFGERLGE